MFSPVRFFKRKGDHHVTIIQIAEEGRERSFRCAQWIVGVSVAVLTAVLTVFFVQARLTDHVLGEPSRVASDPYHDPVATTGRFTSGL